MSATREQITRKAADLTRAEREQLVQYLLSTFEPENEEVVQAWKEEIARRVASYESGEAQLHSMDEVLKEARA